jgi:hypothetical protein
MLWRLSKNTQRVLGLFGSIKRFFESLKIDGNIQPNRILDLSTAFLITDKEIKE